MNKSIVVFGFLSCMIFLSKAQTVEKNDSISLEVLLTDEMLKAANMDINFSSAIDVSSERYVVLSSEDQFYLLGWGGISPTGPKQNGVICSFAYNPGNYLMVVRNNELCYIDSVGSLTKMFNLPSSCMGISRGKSVMYLFDKQGNKSEYSIYILTREKKYYELTKTTMPVQSVCEAGRSIFFSCANILLSVDCETKELKKMASLPDVYSNIVSITHDSINDYLYFSTMNSIYIMKDSVVGIISDKIGGVLYYYNNGLIIFNPEKKFVSRILFSAIKNDE